MFLINSLEKITNCNAKSRGSSKKEWRNKNRNFTHKKIKLNSQLFLLKFLSCSKRACVWIWQVSIVTRSVCMLKKSKQLWSMLLLNILPFYQGGHLDLLISHPLQLHHIVQLRWKLVSTPMLTSLWKMSTILWWWWW